MWPSENVQNAGIHIKIARIIAMAHRFFYQSLDFRAFAHTRYRLNRQSNEMKKQQQQKCVLKVLEKRQKGHHNNNSNNNEIKRQIEREQAISWNVQWKPFCFSFLFDQPFGLHVLIIARWAVCLLLRKTSRAPAQAKNRNKKQDTETETNSWCCRLSWQCVAVAIAVATVSVCGCAYTWYTYKLSPK